MEPDPNLESKTPDDPTPLKKAQSMKRVAEIIMVLSGMAQIRAGKEATAVEKALAAEARERLTAIVEAELKPKDLIDIEAVKVLVEDLGLNKRGPSNKLSISEKVAVTRKKMEESTNFTSTDKSEASCAASSVQNQASREDNTKLLEDATSAQEHSLVTTHGDISRRILKWSCPEVFDHPNWNPPSAEYTTRPLQCQLCKIDIDDTKSLLVCDACEKGVHLKCLLKFGSKEGIPNTEWHCPRCLMSSNGRPFPPKYGLVTGTVPPQKPTPSQRRPKNMPSKAGQWKQVVSPSSTVDVKSETKKEIELATGTSTNEI